MIGPQTQGYGHIGEARPFPGVPHGGRASCSRLPTNAADRTDSLPRPSGSFLCERTRAVQSRLRICHIREAEELTSFRQRGPRISQARIIFALVGVVRFLCQRCAPFGHFPCRLTFGSHLACPIAEIGFSLLRWLPSFFIGCVSAGVFDRAARTLTVGRIPRSGCNRRYAYFAIPSLQVRWRILMR